MSHDFPDGPDYTAEEVARFWTHVVDGPNGCRLWMSYCQPNGYGRFGIFRPGGKHKYLAVLAHRFAYEAEVGPIPPGMHIDHLCFNKACVNPAHLECVTPQENRERQTQKFWTRTHCKRGHELTDDNIILRKNRRTRQCRKCHHMTKEERRNAVV